MSRPTTHRFVSLALRSLDRIAAPARVEAHCDIPCGIYDPHQMQLAALTVVRMNQLIDALEHPHDDKGPHTTHHNSMTRYVLVKEEHAEIVKREVRVIWGDYFKPEHLEKYPDLHTTVWNILKLAGKCRQEVNLQAAQDLLAATQKFAEIFWDSKGAKTHRQASKQGAAGGELVYPDA
ncbi:MAG TPA: superoxide dismutase, Ni [Dehalococcoidia bacterium]|nr:superoxide dismutase, Ni [Dehalococcoidia bacterium]